MGRETFCRESTKQNQIDWGHCRSQCNRRPLAFPLHRIRSRSPSQIRIPDRRRLRLSARITTEPKSNPAACLPRTTVKMAVGLAKIPTLRELYKSGVLKSAEPAKLRHAAKPALLERVSL